MKHLLLIGHGYLGEEVARQALEADWRVTAVSRGEPGATSHPALREESADVSDSGSVSALESRIGQVDFVIHCASSGRGGIEAYEAVYLEGCRNLIAAFPETGLLFTSSSSVYGQTDGSVVTEESPAEPDRETGRLLRAAEEEVLRSGGWVFRLSGIYGDHRSVILRKFLRGEATLEENGERFLNQIHRADAASAIMLAANGSLEPGIWNVSDARPLRQLDCFTELCRLYGRPLPPTAPRDLNRKRGWTHKQVSSAKLQAAGWTPRFPSFLDAVESIAPTVDLRDT